MKVTRDIPEEIPVIVELTEHEASLLCYFIGRTSLAGIAKILELSQDEAAKTNRVLYDLYDKLTYAGVY